MSSIRNPKTNTAKFIKELMFRLKIDADWLAEAFEIDPRTIEGWISGNPIDRNCARLLLDLLRDHPDEVMFFLADRQTRLKEAKPSWPDRIKSIRSRLDLTITDLAAILTTTVGVLAWYENGVKEPASCYAVLLDLLYDHPEQMMNLMYREKEPEHEWSSKEIRELMARLGLTADNLADLLRIDSSRIRAWMRGETVPGHCAGLILELLKSFPNLTRKMLAEIPRESESWGLQRIRDVRATLGFGLLEFAELLKMAEQTLINWESQGLPQGCPVVLYSLLGMFPEEMKKLLLELSR